MTIQGAIYELNNMLSSNDIPCYWKPAIKKIIETVEQNVGMCQQNVGEMSEQMPSYNSIKTELNGDSIPRQAVITMLNKIENAVEDGDGFQFNEWVEYAKDIPSAEKTAEWVAQDIHNCHTDFRCSKCGYIHNFMHLYGKPTTDYTYCPNCGAKMEEKAE